MGAGEKTAQELQETTPINSRNSRHGTHRMSVRNHVLSPPINQRGKRKREQDLDGQEKATPQKKACISGETNVVRKHPVVMLSRMTPEAIAHMTTEHATDTDDEAPSNQEQSDLSPYELERLNNIKQNAKFLLSLNLRECAQGLLSSVRKQNKTSSIKRVKPLKLEEDATRRRSMRVQRINHPLPTESISTHTTEPESMKPAGPLDMTAIYEQDNQSALNSFLKTWESISKEEMCCTKKPSSVDIKRYVANLRQMTLHKKTVAKVVRDRIYSVAIHPSENQMLVAAGGRFGQVGLWDVDHTSPDKVYMFNPHVSPVSCMYFSPVNPAHLLSLSYDGTVRCGDVCHSVFDEIFRDEEDGLSSFDFLSLDASVLIVSQWDAYLSIVDRRTPGTSYEQRASLGMKSVRTVGMHPVNRNLCVAAGFSGVCVYDVRKLHLKKTSPVLALLGHTKSVGSAYFSPTTGNRILTTCADDLIRVFDSSKLDTGAPLLTSIRHDNKTGRWLSRFRPIWDPKLECCFVTGSMERPRQIEVYHEDGKLLHSFRDPELLGSVCSINAVHPTRNVLVGGNSSGRLHVFHE